MHGRKFYTNGALSPSGLRVSGSDHIQDKYLNKSPFSRPTQSQEAHLGTPENKTLFVAEIEKCNLEE
jgi:hypothetical protein